MGWSTKTQITRFNFQAAANKLSRKDILDADLLAPEKSIWTIRICHIYNKWSKGF